jgi:poly(3-hydroxybutyrate) depolymerase
MPEHGQNCGTPYWTNRRYAPEIIDSIGLAINTLKERSGADQVVLVGYSGGGAIAVLLAARRSDVVKVVTVVADLDLTYWTTRDRLSPLEGSLDPAAETQRLGVVRQVHFTGSKDDVVGTDVVVSFLRRLPPGTPARLVEMPGFTHECCWVKEWPSLVAQAVNDGPRP